MPQHKIWFFLFVALLSVMVSCLDVGGKKDEDPTPAEPFITLSVNGSSDVDDFSADVGDTIFLEGTVVAESVIRKFEGKASFGETNTSLVLFEGDSASKEFIIDPISYVIPFNASGQSIIFTFVLSDLEENNDAEVFEVEVGESPILEVEEILIGGYGHATYGNLVNLLEDTVYFPNNVRVSESNQEGVDLILSFDADLGWILSAPDDDNAPTIWDTNVNFNWPFFVRNDTRLQTLPEGFDYEGVQTSAQLEDLFTGEGSSSVASLTVGQVLAIRLDLGKLGQIGLLKVQSSVGGKANVRQINVAYKLQK